MEHGAKTSEGRWINIPSPRIFVESHNVSFTTLYDNEKDDCVYVLYIGLLLHCRSSSHILGNVSRPSFGSVTGFL